VFETAAKDFESNDDGCDDELSSKNQLHELKLDEICFIQNMRTLKNGNSRVSFKLKLSEKEFSTIEKRRNSSFVHYEEFNDLNRLHPILVFLINKIIIQLEDNCLLQDNNILYNNIYWIALKSIFNEGVEKFNFKDIPELGLSSGFNPNEIMTILPDSICEDFYNSITKAENLSSVTKVLRMKNLQDLKINFLKLRDNLDYTKLRDFSLLHHDQSDDDW
jgi:hypothetical protein